MERLEALAAEVDALAAERDMLKRGGAELAAGYGLVSEAREAALRDAADRMPAFHDRNVPEWAITSACRWLRDRADREAER
jgi:hypothetical protein